MKKLLTLLFACAIFTANAQVTFEKRYNTGAYGSLRVAKLSTGAVKYVATTFRSPVVRVYNQDHSLFRQVTLPTVTLGSQYTVGAMSDKLFNQDNALEFIVEVERINPNSPSNSIYTYQVVSESGSVLAAVDSVGGYDFYNTPAGTKWVVYRYPELANGTTDTRFYSVAGVYAPLRTNKQADELTASPFPNPAAERITLPYSVAQGEVAALEVLDMAGRVVKTYKVDSTFNHLLLDAHELRAGTYLYRVSTAAGSSAGKRFVVTR